MMQILGRHHYSFPAFLREERTINAYWSATWVDQRIVPTNRQNLGQVLKDNGLKEYDPYELLMLANGRCAQDDYYLEQISDDKLPKELVDRLKTKVEDVVPLADYRLLVFFRDGAVKRCALKRYFEETRKFAPLLTKEDLYKSMTVSPGGYGVNWGEGLEISDEELQKLGVDIPLSLNDFCASLRSA